MKLKITPPVSLTVVLATILSLSAILASSTANAMLLNAPSSGTYTMNLDRVALQPYYGYFLSTFWNDTDSSLSNPRNTGNYLVGTISTAEISVINRVFSLTPIGSDPSNQPGQRFVKATSENFNIDSDTLTGVTGTQIGMAGVQGFYAPSWPPNGGGVVNGDFSVTYDPSRQSNGQTGWYLANNIFFTMATYDLSNLTVAFSDADNWQLKGDLLMSPENGGMLQGASLNDVGDFCLGVGSYAGCGQVTTVPVPGAIWLLGSGLLGYMGVRIRNQAGQKLTNRENS